MGNIQVFNNAQFGSIRGVEIDGEPWLVGKDVAEGLGYADPNKAIAMHVDDDDKLNDKTASSLGQRGGWFINESGLYSLVMSSKLPSAKSFRRWVTSEVLPSIRKHGAYLTPQKIEEVLLNPDTIIRLATELKAEQEKRRELEVLREADKPKVLLADSISRSDDTISVGMMAKILEQNGISMGRNRLFKALREMGLLMTKNDYNIPTQYSIDNGWFNVDEYTYIDKSGQTQTGVRTRVTGKGQQYLVNRFLRNKGAEK